MPSTVDPCNNERVSAFHKIIANVQAALDRRAAVPTNHIESAQQTVPFAPGARRAELASQFARELERLGGHFLGVLSAAEARDRIVAVARELEARGAAFGEGIMIDFEPFARALDAAGIAVIRPSDVENSDRAEMRARLANCDLAVVEADYGIAATGTLAIVATPRRPSSLTLLPPANIIVVDMDRMLPDLSAVISALGPSVIASHRVALISGPSRTADIEKRIVLGVHGPRLLYSAVVSSPAEATPR
jgi:L-lactate dehydrogenase complex protein LldG